MGEDHFVEHYRDVVRGGKLQRGMPCPGWGHTWEEARAISETDAQ
jgi:hypothetical protein